MGRLLKRLLILILFFTFIYEVANLFYKPLKNYYVKAVVRNFVQLIEMKNVTVEENLDKKSVEDLIYGNNIEKELTSVSKKIKNIKGINEVSYKELKEFVYSDKDLNIELEVSSLKFFEEIFD